MKTPEQLVKDFTQACCSMQALGRKPDGFDALESELIVRLKTRDETTISRRTIRAFSDWDATQEVTIETQREVKWRAWLADREDGIVGSGETEDEAIKALAEQQRGED